MQNKAFHIYRNNLLGRETLLQAAYFSQTLHIPLCIYPPKEEKFLMYFQNEAIQIDLDKSYIRSHSTSLEHIHQILSDSEVKLEILEPQQYSASNLPDIPTDFIFMSCPRIISDLSSKIRLGQIGPKVRQILKAAPFPVLIPCSVFKPWRSITVFFGGSVHGVRSLQVGIKLAQESKMPLYIFTQASPGEKEKYQEVIHKRNLSSAIQKNVQHWYYFEEGNFQDNLFVLPHDTLIVIGTHGHNILKDMMFGSTMELVQSVCPNNMIIVGKNFNLHPWYNTKL